MSFKKYINKKNLILAVTIKIAILILALFFIFGSNLISKVNATYGIDQKITQAKSASSNTVYYINHYRGKKKAYVCAQSFLVYGNNWKDIKIVSQDALDQLPDINLVKTEAGPAVYYIYNGQKILIKSEADFNSLGLYWDDVVTIKQADLDNYAPVDDYSIVTNTYKHYGSKSSQLEVSLDANSPQGKYIPLNTKNNAIAIFDLKSSSATVQIKSLTINLRGVHSAQEVGNINITNQDDVPYDATPHVNGSKVTFSFDNAPMTINEGDTRKVNVKVDIISSADSANHSIQASLDDYKAIETDAYVNGNFPVSGIPFMFLSGTNALPQVSVQELSLGNASGNQKPLIGSTDQLIGKFKITETSRRDNLVISQLSFISKGSAMYSDLANFKLREANNSMISQVGSMSTGGIVTFNIKNYKINKGNSSDFILTADIISGEGRTINFDLYDYKISGENFNFNLTADSAPLSESLSINREAVGVVSVDLKPNNKVFANQTGVILGSFQIRNGNRKLSIDQLDFSLLKNAAAPQISSTVSIVNYDTGDVLGSISGVNFSSSENILYVNNINLNQLNSMKISLVTDIPDQAKNGDYYTAVFNKIGYYSDNRQHYVDTVNVSGVRLNVSRSNLYVYPNNLEAAYQYTKGQKNIKIASFILEAAAGDGVSITSITLANGSDTSGLVTYENGFSNLRITVNGASPANNIAVPTGGSYVFDGIRTTISASGRAEVKVYADTISDLKVNESQLMLVKIVAKSASSGIPSNITNVNVNSAKTSYGNAQARLTAIAGGSAAAKNYGNLVASFQVENTGQETLALYNIIVETSAEGFTNSLGYSNLRIVNREKKYTVGGVSAPVAGANVIGLASYYLDPNKTIIFDVFVDANSAVSSNQFQIYFRNLNAVGKNSNIRAVVDGDPTNGVNFIAYGGGSSVTTANTLSTDTTYSASSVSSPVTFVWPCDSRKINYYFHDPNYPFRSVSEHTGIDIALSQGSVVKAAADGTVITVVYNHTTDLNYVTISHDSNLTTWYFHLSSVNVHVGQTVKAGQIVGLSGGTPGTTGAGQYTTGPHLHFEVQLNGVPVDPMEYLK